MHGREVQDETQMLGEPWADCFSMMGTDIVIHKVNRVDLLVNVPVQRAERGDKFLLWIPFIARKGPRQT